MKRKKLISILTTACMVFALAGCGSTDTKDSGNTEAVITEEAVTEAPTEASEDTSTAFPITISHAYGETTVKEKPERVVSLAWSNEDAVLALGIVPVGTSAANFGAVGESGLLPWTEEAYAFLGETNPVVYDDTDGFDYEAIADSNPDIIVASYSGMTKEEYDTLSQIAPTIPYKETAWKTTWRNQTMEIATALGLETEGKDLVAETEKTLESVKEAHSEVVGKSAALFWIDPTDLGTFYVYTTTDPRGAYLEDLGFEFPESIAQIDDGTSFSLAISSENIDLLNDVDIMIAYGDEETLKAMQEDPLFSQIPAVANGNVVLLDAASKLAAACNPSVLSIPEMAEEYMSLIHTTYTEAE